MSSQSIEQFKQYLANQDDDFLQDGRRVEGIIRDIFSEERSIIFPLTIAWKAGVVTELRKTANLEVTIAQCGDRLCQEYSLRESSASSAVHVWAYALRVTDAVPNINFNSTPPLIIQSSITAETKKCPFCAEEVKKDARKCRYCHSDISDDVVFNEKQNNELIRQQEALNREKQKLERERQELSKKAAQEVEQKKLEQKRRELEENKKQLSSSAISRAFPTANEIGRDGHFIAYNAGIVIDTKTNLMWAAKDNGASINWNNAKKYCENYRGGGYADWRVPTLNELTSLYDESKEHRIRSLSSVYLTYSIELTDIFLWAVESRASEAARFSFLGGKIGWGPQSGSRGHERALPVRSAK